MTRIFGKKCVLTFGMGCGLMLLASLLAHRASGQAAAQLIGSKRIWNAAPLNLDSDLVRFKDRWYVAFQESTGPYAQDGSLRVLVSADGKTWESAAHLESPTSNKSLWSPRFVSAPDGRLMLTAGSIVPTPGVPDPVPKYGGTVQTLAWHSADGLEWGRPARVGLANFPLDRPVWHKEAAFAWGVGCICGSAQTVCFLGGAEGKLKTLLFEETFSGFFPSESAFVFVEDTAYCLLSRRGATIGNPLMTGYLGTAKAPYDRWEWKELAERITHPNLFKLSERQVIAAVGLYDKKGQMVLCDLDPVAGALKPMLEIPTGGEMQHLGVALNGGELLASYHAQHEGRPSIHIATAALMER